MRLAKNIVRKCTPINANILFVRLRRITQHLVFVLFACICGHKDFIPLTQPHLFLTGAGYGALD